MEQEISIQETKFHPSFQSQKKKKQEEIEEKISKSIEKHIYISKIQQQYVQKLRLKNEFILQKVEKSIENKSASLQKIKQKCKNKRQMQEHKIEQIKKRQEMETNRYWKQSKRLSNTGRSRETKKKIVDPIPQQKQQQQDGGFITSVQVKIDRLPLFPNKEREENYRIRKSPLSKVSHDSGQRKSLDLSKIQEKQVTISALDNHENWKQNKSQRNTRISKTHQIEKKIEEMNKNQEQLQVESFNKKMQKLEIARMKKNQLQKQKQKKIHEQMKFKREKIEEMYRTRNSFSQERSPSQSKQKRAKTDFDTHDDHFVTRISPKNALFRQWEENNKVRQIELLEQRLTKGNAYLKQMKNKAIKNKLTKELENFAIEKKLYEERNRLHQLATQNLSF